MTQSEKLEALVRKAFGNDPGVADWHLDSVISDGSFIKCRDKSTSQIQLMDAWRFLFNHDFARALFGEEEITVAMAKKDLQVGFVTTEDVYEPYPVKVFKYHLQQAVISNDPISYMYKVASGDET